MNALALRVDANGDKWLACVECRVAFLWGIEEREWMIARGLKQQPQRCRVCRVVARARREVAKSGGLEPLTPGEIVCGTIVRLKPDRGFGFIARTKRSESVFFHASDLRDRAFDEVRLGDVVYAEVVSRPGKGWRAAAVYYQRSNEVATRQEQL